MSEIVPLGLTIPEDWKWGRLGNHTSKIGSGATPRGGSSVYVDEGIAFVRSQNVYDHEFKSDGLVRITDEAAHALRGVSLQRGDVLINITGDSILRTTVVPDEVIPARVNQHVSIVRSDGSMDPLFIQKWLSTRVMKDFMLGLSSGATRKAVTKGHLESLPVPIPPLPEQQAIAATLGALDDKIESNRRAAGIAECLLRSLVESELAKTTGELGVLSDYCSLVRSTVRADGIDPDENYIGLEHMPRGSVFLDTWVKAAGIGSNKNSFRPGDVLFGRLRPYFKKVGIAPIGGVCSTDILVLRPKKGRDLGIVASVAASEELIGSVSAGATGTRMPRASWADLANWPVPLLTEVERDRLAARVTPLIERTVRATLESRTLTTLRDTLLPELMSGQIRVRSAEDSR